MQSYLDKKSPILIKGWQKRYFWFFKNQKMILYFKKKPDGMRIYPQGTIHLDAVTSLEVIGKHEFHIKYEGRKYELKTDNSQLREEWLAALKPFVSEQGDEEENKDMKKQNKMKRQETKKNNEWTNISQVALQGIYLEREQIGMEALRQKMEQRQLEVRKLKKVEIFLAKLTEYVHKLSKIIFSIDSLKKGVEKLLKWSRKDGFLCFQTFPQRMQQFQRSNSKVVCLHDISSIQFTILKYKTIMIKRLLEMIQCMKIDNLELPPLPIEPFPENYIDHGFELKFIDLEKKKPYTLYGSFFTDVKNWYDILTIVSQLERDEKMQQSEKDQKKKMSQQLKSEKKRIMAGSQKKQLANLMEGQFELKINNTNQWKNAIVIVTSDSFSYNFIDTEKITKVYHYDIKKLESSGRIWIVHLPYESLQFRCSAQREQDEWTEKFAQIAEIERSYSEQRQQSSSEIQQSMNMKGSQSNYHQNSLMKQSTKEIPSDFQQNNQKQSGFSSLFQCCTRPPADLE